MLKHTKYRPYIRRLQGNETAHDLETNIQLSFYKKLLKTKDIKKAYVLTQRGFPNHALAVSCTKENLYKITSLTNKEFKPWSITTQKNIKEADPLQPFQVPKQPTP